ncbi:MerR family transcriptional regulator [Schumannella soli]|uniref:MerR family transcriptional regulator n=1 Tax=Schumannella soli TaxID=2590779 RepID=A0A506Y9N5_9MICO|nr:MerR family transcriptional regulator [Schumannella soli]TPW77169.1 MerR family transcriptional regulator [Schumannella soli]
MRIGDLSAATGASVRSLRYYEEQGLIAPERTAGGQREFDDLDPARVAFIQQLFAAGMTSSSIRELLPCTHSGRTTRAQRARLRADRDRIAEQIDRLVQARDRLDHVIELAEERADGVESDPESGRDPDRGAARESRADGGGGWWGSELTACPPRAGSAALSAS